MNTVIKLAGVTLYKLISVIGQITRIDAVINVPDSTQDLRVNVLLLVVYINFLKRMHEIWRKT